MSRSSVCARLYKIAFSGSVWAFLAVAVAASAASPETGRASIAPAAFASGGLYALNSLAGQPHAGVSAGGAFRLSGGWLAPATPSPLTATAAPATATVAAPASPSPQPSTTSVASAATGTPIAGLTRMPPPPTPSPANTSAQCVASVPGQYSLPALDSGLQRLFLPAVLRGGDPATGPHAATPGQSAAPDLVTQFELCLLAVPGRIALRVTVTNVGEAATPADGFWVDAYLNPAHAPARALPWDEACSAWPCYGATWQVSRPLDPGESIILLDTDLAPAFRVWPAAPPGQLEALFVYADSYTDDDNPAGLVREADESNNRSDLPAEWAGLAMAEPALIPAPPEGSERRRP